MDDSDDIDFLRFGNGRGDDDFVDISIMTTTANQQQQRHCSICAKDLSHLDALRRSQHLNRCLDEKDVESNVVRIVDNYDRTRDCPLCFEPLAPGPHRVMHYKRCSKSHNVSAAEMNEMISHNDRVAQIRKRSGIAHTRARQKSPSKLQKDIVTKMKKKDKIGPKDLSDEHLQTALALSRSENNSVEDPEIILNIVGAGRKGSNLKQAKIPTLLESTNTEARLQVMQERLFQIILAQNCGSSAGDKENSNLVESRWWRIHASGHSVDISDYQIQLFKDGFIFDDGVNFETASQQ